MNKSILRLITVRGPSGAACKLAGAAEVAAPQPLSVHSTLGTEFVPKSTAPKKANPGCRSDQYSFALPSYACSYLGANGAGPEFKR